MEDTNKLLVTSQNNLEYRLPLHYSFKHGYISCVSLNHNKNLSLTQRSPTHNQNISRNKKNVLKIRMYHTSKILYRLSNWNIHT